MKATRAEKVKRTNDVMGLILDGYTKHEIALYASEMWQIGERQAQEYRVWAAKRLERIGNRDTNEIFYKIKTRYERQYRRAIANKDNRLAASLLKDMVEFYGFKAPVKIAHTDPSGTKEARIIYLPEEETNGKLETTTRETDPSS